MIISGKQIQGALKLYNENKTIGKTTRQDKIVAGSKNDQVILSSQAQEFSQMLQSLKNMPDVRPERVEPLAKKVHEGTYQVSGQAIAEKMLGRLFADRIKGE